MPGPVTKTSSALRLPTWREPQHINRDVASSNSDAFLAGQRLLLVEDASPDLGLARIRPPVDEVMIAAMNHGHAIATRSIRSTTPSPDDPADALFPLRPHNCPPTPGRSLQWPQPEVLRKVDPPSPDDRTDCRSLHSAPTPAPELSQINSPNLVEWLLAEDGAPEPQWLRDLPPLEEERSQPALMHKEDIPPPRVMSEGAVDLQFTKLLPQALSEDRAIKEIELIPPPAKIKTGEQGSKRLRPLENADLRDLAAKLLVERHLDVETWARVNGINPKHVKSCVTDDGALSEYGQARLNNAFFRDLRYTEMASLQTWLKQPNKSVQQWAIGKNIHPYSITDYVTNGALNDKGQVRLARARARAPAWRKKARQRISERIRLRTRSPEEYQSLRRKGFELLKKGKRPFAVAKELQLVPHRVCIWHRSLVTRGEAAVEPLKRGAPRKLTPAQEEELRNSYLQQKSANFGLGSKQQDCMALSKASGDIVGKKVSKMTIYRSLLRHKLVQPRPSKAALKPLKNEELGSLETDLGLYPALDVEDWAHKRGIIPHHAAACVTEGALNAYGQARLKGKTTFRHLNDENVKALKAHLKNPDRNIERWAIDNGIFRYEITACIAEDGKLSELGRARWDLAMKRTKPDAQSQFRISSTTLEKETYQTLQHAAIKQLKLGLGPVVVANELGIPRSTLNRWHQKFMKHGEVAVEATATSGTSATPTRETASPPKVGKRQKASASAKKKRLAAHGETRKCGRKPGSDRILSPEDETKLKAALDEQNPIEFGAQRWQWTKLAVFNLFKKVFPNRKEISQTTALKCIKAYGPWPQARTRKRNLTSKNLPES